MTGIIGIAIVTIVALAAFLTFALRLWQHKIPDALSYLGLSLVLGGSLLEIVALSDFVSTEYVAGTLSWGTLPMSVFTLPYVVGFVLMAAGGLVALLLRLETTARLIRWMEGFVFRHNAVSESYRTRMQRAAAAEQTSSGERERTAGYAGGFTPGHSTTPHGS